MPVWFNLHRISQHREHKLLVSRFCQELSLLTYFGGIDASDRGWPCKSGFYWRELYTFERCCFRGGSDGASRTVGSGFRVKIYRSRRGPCRFELLRRPNESEDGGTSRRLFRSCLSGIVWVNPTANHSRYDSLIILPPTRVCSHYRLHVIIDAKKNARNTPLW
jgi:hypothetical protein